MNEQKPEITLKGNRGAAFRINEESITVYSGKKLIEEIPWEQVHWKYFFGERGSGELTFWRETARHICYFIDTDGPIVHTFSLLCPNQRTIENARYETVNREHLSRFKPEELAQLYTEEELKQKKTLERLIWPWVLVMLALTLLLFPITYCISENLILSLVPSCVTLVLIFVFPIRYGDAGCAPLQNFNARIALKKERETASQTKE